jgi:hypothetical protein
MGEKEIANLRHATITGATDEFRKARRRLIKNNNFGGMFIKKSND